MFVTCFHRCLYRFDIGVVIVAVYVCYLFPVFLWVFICFSICLYVFCLLDALVGGWGNQPQMQHGCIGCVLGWLFRGVLSCVRLKQIEVSVVAKPSQPSAALMAPPGAPAIPADTSVAMAAWHGLCKFVCV